MIVYMVNPRYTAGSPAQVDRETAHRVASQEQAAWVDAVRAWRAGDSSGPIPSNHGIVLSRMEAGHRFVENGGAEYFYWHDLLVGRAWTGNASQTSPPKSSKADPEVLAENLEDAIALGTAAEVNSACSALRDHYRSGGEHPSPAAMADLFHALAAEAHVFAAREMPPSRRK